MKKLISFILALLILSGVLVSSAAATGDKDVTYNDKFQDDLNLYLATTSQDEISVWLWLNHSISKLEIDKQTTEKCGLTLDALEVDYSKYETVEEAIKVEKARSELWRATRNYIINKFYLENNQMAIEKLGINKESVVFSSISSASVIVTLKLDELLKIAKSNIVVSVNLYSEEDEVPPSNSLTILGKLHNVYDISGTINEFSEIYWQINDTNGREWLLLKFSENKPKNHKIKPYLVIGDRLIRQNEVGSPFVFGYGVYNNVTDTFYDIKDFSVGDNSFDLQGVLSCYGIGELIGDINGDQVITIKDATDIQKCTAMLQSFSADDIVDGEYISYSEKLGYVSDFNRDLERNIKDATAIQKYIAGLEY